MNNSIRSVDGNDDHQVFYLNGKLYGFFAESSLLLQLNPDTCFDGNLLCGDFIEALANLDGKLKDCEGTGRAVVAEAAKDHTPAVSALNLNLTDKCNLNCVYCYASGGDYDRITNDMSFDTFEKALDDAKDVIDQTRPFRFEFFGGEPLMNREVIEKVLEWEKSQSHTDKPIINRISTSLSFLTPELEDALVTGNFILSVSLDGTRETQNAQRPFKSGGGTYDEIIKNITRMKERAPHLVTVARITAYKNAGHLSEEIEELRKLNIFDYCSVYSAAIEDDDGGKLYMTDEYRESYLKFAASYNDYLEDDENIFKGCLELNRYISHILSGTTALNHCRAGSGYYTLSPDSSVHPCHRFIGDEDMAIEGGLPAIESTPEFWRKTVLDRDDCAKCLVRYFCGGGCKQENLISTGSPLGISEKNCQFAQLIFDAALIAIDGLSEKSKKRLSEICEKSTDLFVLCGQNVGHTEREKLTGLAKEFLADYLL